jgi:hypothetical protein
MPTPPGQPVLQLRVVLDGVEPVVWRRLLVPGGVRLDKLHRMLQAAMGPPGLDRTGEISLRDLVKFVLAMFRFSYLSGSLRST